MGPVGFIINVTDLKCMTQGNQLCKYADDMYNTLLSANSQSIPAELAHIESWASKNNLKLNTNKSQEMNVRRPRARKVIIPPTLPGITRVVTNKILGVEILGVVIQDNLSTTCHRTGGSARDAASTESMHLKHYRPTECHPQWSQRFVVPRFFRNQHMLLLRGADTWMQRS